MSLSSGSFGSNAVEERRAQRVLNEKVGDRLLPRRSLSQRLRGRLRTVGSRRSERAE
jgi:hypothetical protein